MQRKISIILSISIIIGIFSGCMIKKDASTTGEVLSEINVEVTPEVTVETTTDTTKEPAKEQPNMNNNSEGNKNTDNSNQNQSQPDDKTEATPEFYDFMTLDPDVDIENEQVREDIGKKIFHYAVNEDAVLNFTKKENYLYEITNKKNWRYLSYTLYSDKEEFYSKDTAKKLSDLGLTFELYARYYRNEKVFRLSNAEYVTSEGYINKLEKALKILLEDRNVVYVDIFNGTAPPN